MSSNYECEECNTTSDKFRCATCNRMYSYRESLYNHQKYECGKLPQFACPYCPYRAKRKGTLKDHLFNKHSVIKGEERVNTLSGFNWALAPGNRSKPRKV
ncbi:longitudinals lacking protein, isoforms A/B/D/L-like [Rhodnius prolixus]|uniref:longitudinals lacking protein, isoforms A/B/D/L-like n=1 Tax=Rhodnius prolixus TaxID=13249 RepID=UPI003D18D679